MQTTTALFSVSFIPGLKLLLSSAVVVVLVLNSWTSGHIPQFQYVFMTKIYL